MSRLFNFPSIIGAHFRYFMIIRILTRVLAYNPTSPLCEITFSLMPPLILHVTELRYRLGPWQRKSSALCCVFASLLFCSRPLVLHHQKVDRLGKPQQNNPSVHGSITMIQFPSPSHLHRLLLALCLTCHLHQPAKHTIAIYSIKSARHLSYYPCKLTKSYSLSPFSTGLASRRTLRA